MLNARWLLGLGLAASALLSACTTNTTLGQAGEDAGPDAGPDVWPTTGCKPTTSSVDLGCNDDPSLPTVAGVCEIDGTCICGLGFALNPATGRCKLVNGTDSGVVICTVGADHTCNDDASVSAIIGTCVGGVACACKTGFLLNPATGRCKAGSSADAGADSAPSGLVCTALVDQTCNDDDTFSGVAGHCGKSGTCACNPGYAVNPATGRCRAVPTSDASSTTNVCTPGMDQTCNDLPMSALAGACQADGTCVCRSGYEINPTTGLCGPEVARSDASPGDDTGASRDTGLDTTDASVGKDADPAGVCTPGKNQTCNDSPAASDVGGICQNDGTCVCDSGHVLNPSSGRCADAPRDASPDRQPACTYPVNETCNHNQAASDSVRGTCQPDGTCVCLPGYVIVPSTGRCDPPQQDAGLVTKPACTPGIDQTCNDNPSVSMLWGTCKANGTCACNTGYVINASTGRCMSPVANSCSGAYDACGCGCCPGASPQPVCYYPSAGDSLPTIIADDQEARDNATCTAMGCTQGERYLCCTEAAPEPAGSAQYNAVYTAGGYDRIGLTRVGSDSYCVLLNLVQSGLSSTNPSKLRVTTPADWVVDGSISRSGCNVTTGSTSAIGAQGTVTFSLSGTSCAINAHVTLFFAANADAPVTTMRIDADAVAIKGGPTGFCK